MAILINLYTTISPYLYSVWFHDPLLSNHLKIMPRFIIGLGADTLFLQRQGLGGLKTPSLQNNNQHSVSVTRKERWREKLKWQKVKKSHSTLEDRMITQHLDRIDIPALIWHLLGLRTVTIRFMYQRFTDQSTILPIYHVWTVAICMSFYWMYKIKQCVFKNHQLYLNLEQEILISWLFVFLFQFKHFTLLSFLLNLPLNLSCKQNKHHITSNPENSFYILKILPTAVLVEKWQESKWRHTSIKKATVTTKTLSPLFKTDRFQQTCFLNCFFSMEIPQKCNTSEMNISQTRSSTTSSLC